MPANVPFEREVQERLPATHARLQPATSGGTTPDRAGAWRHVYYWMSLNLRAVPLHNPFAAPDRIGALRKAGRYRAAFLAEAEEDMADISAALGASQEAVNVNQLIVTSERAGGSWISPRAPGKSSPRQFVEHVARALEESANVAAGRSSKFPKRSV